jgi:hypothetical protein
MERCFDPDEIGQKRADFLALWNRARLLDSALRRRGVPSLNYRFREAKWMSRDQ